MLSYKEFIELYINAPKEVQNAVDQILKKNSIDGFEDILLKLQNIVSA